MMPLDGTAYNPEFAPRWAEIENAHVFILQQSGEIRPPRGIRIVFRSLKKNVNTDGRKLPANFLSHCCVIAYIENAKDPFS